MSKSHAARGGGVTKGRETKGGRGVQCPWVNLPRHDRRYRRGSVRIDPATCSAAAVSLAACPTAFATWAGRSRRSNAAPESSNKRLHVTAILSEPRRVSIRQIPQHGGCSNQVRNGQLWPSGQPVTKATKLEVDAGQSSFIEYPRAAPDHTILVYSSRRSRRR